MDKEGVVLEATLGTIRVSDSTQGGGGGSITLKIPESERDSVKELHDYFGHRLQVAIVILPD